MAARLRACCCDHVSRRVGQPVISSAHGAPQRARPQRATAGHSALKRSVGTTCTKLWGTNNETLGVRKLQVRNSAHSCYRASPQTATLQRKPLPPLLVECGGFQAIRSPRRTPTWVPSCPASTEGQGTRIRGTRPGLASHARMLARTGCGVCMAGWLVRSACRCARAAAVESAS